MLSDCGADAEVRRDSLTAAILLRLLKATSLRAKGHVEGRRGAQGCSGDDPELWGH
jgi:hypothetical protein